MRRHAVNHQRRWFSNGRQDCILLWSRGERSIVTRGTDSQALKNVAQSRKCEAIRLRAASLIKTGPFMSIDLGGKNQGAGGAFGSSAMEQSGAKGRIDPMPDYNLSLDLVRCTEAAALAAARWVGRGDKNAADQAAVDAMRLFFNMVHMDGVVVIGEGEKDQAPMLYNGESIGTGDEPAVDVAVDPIDGTRLVSRGEANALAVVALAERGAMFNPGPCVYMEKIATGRESRGGHRYHSFGRDQYQADRQDQADAGQRSHDDDPRSTAA